MKAISSLVNVDSIDNDKNPEGGFQQNQLLNEYFSFMNV